MNKLPIWPSPQLTHHAHMQNHPLVPADIAARFDIREWRNGLAILAAARPSEWADIQGVLRGFRLLFDLRAIDVGVIITRASGLQAIFNALGRGPRYGNSTTHLEKLLPRLEGGGGGGCPVVVMAIKPEAYVDDGPAQ